MVSKELRKLISAGRKAGIAVEDMAKVFHVGRSTMDLFGNLFVCARMGAGCRTSRAKYCVFCCFLMVVVWKLKFPNNSNI
jgi:hypothetical protein